MIFNPVFYAIGFSIGICSVIRFSHIFIFEQEGIETYSGPGIMSMKCLLMLFAMLFVIAR